MAGKAGQDPISMGPVGGDGVQLGVREHTVVPVHRSTHRWFIAMAAVTQLIDITATSQLRYLLSNMTFGAVFSCPVGINQLRW